MKYELEWQYFFMRLDYIIIIIVLGLLDEIVTQNDH